MRCDKTADSIAAHKPRPSGTGQASALGRHHDTYLPWH
jgi:hypothetical protein